MAVWGTALPTEDRVIGLLAYHGDEDFSLSSPDIISHNLALVFGFHFVSEHKIYSDMYSIKIRRRETKANSTFYR